MIQRSYAVTILLVAGILVGCSKRGIGTNTGGSDKATSASSSTQDQPERSAKGGAQPNDVVRIPEPDQHRAGIQVAYALVQRTPRMLSVAGQVAMDEQHTSHLGTIADGRIMSVSVLPGAVVHRGQVLGSLHSHMVHETVGSLVQAYAAVDRQRGALAFAKQAQERYHHLYLIQAASQEEAQRSDQEVLQAQQMLVDAEANVHMEREHLSELLQVPPDSLNPNNLYDRELIPIRSPIDGVVITRNVSLGQVVETGFVAFDIANLSTVWVTAAVNQQDLPLMRQGAAVDVVTAGYPDQVFHGRVAMIGDTLNPETRTLPVRVVVPNPGTKIKPGMFVFRSRQPAMRSLCRRTRFRTSTACQLSLSLRTELPFRRERSMSAPGLWVKQRLSKACNQAIASWSTELSW